jgi:2-polyprenyl-3-methyl-5-hydroxy-6-metoxy-1,4-benzoquinol methylase
LWLFKRNRKKHWERIYQKHAATELGWYQENPKKSLQLIDNTGASKASSIIDVGGGTSKLSQYLLHQGYKKIAVLDISENSIEDAKLQLGEQSNRIDWVKMVEILPAAAIAVELVEHFRDITGNLIRPFHRTGKKRGRKRRPVFQQAGTYFGHLQLFRAGCW